MAQLVRALAILREDPDSVPSTSMVAHNPVTPVPVNLAFVGTACMWCNHINKKKTL